MARLTAFFCRLDSFWRSKYVRLPYGSCDQVLFGHILVFNTWKSIQKKSTTQFWSVQVSKTTRPSKTSGHIISCRTWSNRAGGPCCRWRGESSIYQAPQQCFSFLEWWSLSFNTYYRILQRASQNCSQRFGFHLLLNSLGLHILLGFRWFSWGHHGSQFTCPWRKSLPSMGGALFKNLAAIQELGGILAKGRCQRWPWLKNQ